eukprot:985455-Pleurochrysis_carterae.AAC.2
MKRTSSSDKGAKGGKKPKSVGFSDGVCTGTGSGSLQNQGGLPSAPRTRQSEALNTQGGSVRGARDANRNAARVQALERAAAKRASTLHASQRREEQPLEAERLEAER